MFERTFTWLAGENLLIFGGLTFALLSFACEAAFRLGAYYTRDERRPHRMRRVAAIEAQSGGVFPHHAVDCIRVHPPALFLSLTIVPQRPKHRPVAVAGMARQFARCLAELRRVEWVVYAKRPFAGPGAVLAYLARYTHRVAMSNNRLVALTGGQVSFRWRDYRHHNKNKVTTLAAAEFIRRFLLHALPDGFHRIRHYGFFANRRRAEKLWLPHAARGR
jgi:hypothetical protein